MKKKKKLKKLYERDKRSIEILNELMNELKKLQDEKNRSKASYTNTQ